MYFYSGGGKSVDGVGVAYFRQQKANRDYFQDFRCVKSGRAVWRDDLRPAAFDGARYSLSAEGVFMLSFLSSDVRVLRPSHDDIKSVIFQTLIGKRLV
jgi:hypothetical protein